ncbi:hypothetical protein FRACYDRAFT_248542 [Fragilariopsis cylindrus CCMP1102]|uniref:RNI-like protein n=1 Tax=Fragilariopsis cylindrus CCMP1102 TaxID=635003 RepID=A0A1E7ET59_9STRA|nr:hypothetical protein FRACYDRAFT_248542 [Fragilariopsis cylindrus CCMP1102]|eukprot:OEU09208.1 hypothetical protein FRACYDRAFT_248542 [Fragilariopsis cylindrus CCMP1102]
MNKSAISSRMAAFQKAATSSNTNNTDDANKNGMKSSVGKLSKSKISALNIPLGGGRQSHQQQHISSKVTIPTMSSSCGNTDDTNKNEAKKSVGKLSMSKINAINIPGMGGGPRGGTQQQHQQSRSSKENMKPKPGKTPPKINMTMAHNDHTSQGHTEMSEKAKATIVGPKRVGSEQENWDFLYELASQYDQYKLQEKEEMKNPIKQKSATPEKKPQVQGDKKSIKSSLEGLFGGGTSYTANGKFLTKEYFDPFILENTKFSTVTFDFSNEGTKLFKRFDRKDQEQRDISQKFVAALLSHPRASEITHLSMSNALLPDEFLVALSEQCLLAGSGGGGGGLPKLQVMNLESNLLGIDGLIAVSKCIADPNVWCRLQILKLENQKAELTSDAEETLGKAVVHSRSLVAVGLHVKGGIPKQQIDNTIKANVDILRQARRKHKLKTGSLKERKRNDMEQYFDKIVSNTDPSITDVDLTGNLKFIGLNATERIKSGSSFGTNTTVKSIKMVKLQLDDDFAVAFGKALITNSTLETVILDSNSFSGTGIQALLTGLGKNKAITNFQIRHQTKKINSSDEEVLPLLLKENTTVINLGIDARNQMIKMQLDRKTNENREYQRKQRNLNKK